MTKNIKLSKIEKAIICLAEHIELSHTCEYNVREEILDILQIEFIKFSKSK